MTEREEFIERAKRFDFILFINGFRKGEVYKIKRKYLAWKNPTMYLLGNDDVTPSMEHSFNDKTCIFITEKKARELGWSE